MTHDGIVMMGINAKVRNPSLAKGHRPGQNATALPVSGQAVNGSVRTVGEPLAPFNPAVSRVLANDERKDALKAILLSYTIPPPYC